MRALALMVLMAGGKMALAAPLAVLSDVKGKVQVGRGARFQEAKSGALLEAGDVVNAIAGNATIFYASRAPQVVRPGMRVRLSARRNADPKPSVWKGLFAGLSSGFARRVQSRPMTAPSMSGGPNVPRALAPSGALLTPRPTFVWMEAMRLPGLELRDYEVTVEDAQGQRVWSGTSAGTTLTYPPEAPALVEGPYSWQVVARRLMAAPGQSTKSVQRDERMKSAPFSFVVPKAAKRTAMAQEVARLEIELADETPSLRRLAIASALQEEGFSTAALERLQPEKYAPSAGVGAAAPAMSAPSAMSAPTVAAAAAPDAGEDDPMAEAARVLLGSILAATK